MMQIIRKSKAVMMAVMIVVLGVLTACSTNGKDTTMEISFRSTDFKDNHKEKTLSINENIDRLVLDGTIQVDCGTVMLSVVNDETKETVWSQDYFHDTDFVITLIHLKKGSHYTVVMDTKQTKAVQLILSSEKKVIEDIEKPEVQSL